MNLNNETKNLFLIASKKKENPLEPQKLIDYKTKTQLKSISTTQSKNTQTVFNSQLETTKSPKRDKKILTLQNFKKEENLLFNLTKTETMTEFSSSKFFSQTHRPFVRNSQNLSNKSKRKMSQPQKLNELVLQLNPHLDQESNARENSNSQFIQKYMLFINNLLKSNSQSPKKTSTINDNSNKFYTIQNFRDELDTYKKFLESTSSKERLEQNANLILKNSGFYDKFNTMNSDIKEPICNRKNSEIFKGETKSPSLDSNINLTSKTISGNKYLKKVLQNVMRKVCYVNNRNEKITEDYVVNLIKEESKDINQNLDNIFESFCKIKNFSHVMSEKEETFLLPFINSIIEKKNSSVQKTSENFKKNVENIVDIGNFSNFANSKRIEKKNSQKGIFSTNSHTNTNSLSSLNSINSLSSFNPYNQIWKEKFYGTSNNFNKYDLTTINENTEDSKRLNTKTQGQLRTDKNDQKIEINPIEKFHSSETCDFNFKSENFENLHHETEENPNRIVSSRSGRFSSLNNSQRFNSDGNLPKFYADTETNPTLNKFKNFNKNEMITDLLKNQNILDWLKLNIDEKDSKFYTANSTKNLNKIKSEIQSEIKISEDNKTNEPIESSQNQIQDENSLNYPETPENNYRNKCKSVLFSNRRNTLINKENLEKLKRERYSNFKKYNTEMKIENERSEKFRSSSNKLIKQFYENEDDEKNANALEVNEVNKSYNSEISGSVKNTLTITEEDKKTLQQEKSSKHFEEKDNSDKFNRKRSKKLDSIAIKMLNQKLEQELEENKYFLLDPNKKDIFDKNLFDDKAKKLVNRKSNYKEEKNEKGKGILKKIKSKASLMKNDSNEILNPNQITNQKSTEKKKISYKMTANNKLKSNPRKSKFISKLKSKTKINFQSATSNEFDENLEVDLNPNQNAIENDEINLLNNSKNFNEVENENLKENLENDKEDSTSSENSLFNKLNQIGNQVEEQISEENQKSSDRFNPMAQTEEFSILDSYDDKEENLSNDNLNDSNQILDPNSEIKDILKLIKKRDKSRTLIPKKLKPTRLNTDIEVEKEKPESYDRVKILADLIDQNLSQQITRRNAKKYTYSQKNDIGDIFLKDPNSHKKHLIKPLKTSKNELDQYKLKMKQMKKGLDSLNVISSNEVNKRNLNRLNTMNMMKEMDLKINFEYYMMNPEIPSETKNKFLELQQQIEQMKKFDTMSYVENLEKHFADFKGEMESIQNLKEIEDRMNRFFKSFNEWRSKFFALRTFWNNKLKVKDNKFKFSLGPLMS